jgi:hypothetical protein
MNRFRPNKRTHAMLLLAAAWSLCACGATNAPKPVAPQTAANVRAGAEYPTAIRGTWMLGPEPCYLPASPDADGRFVIEADAISGYESAYKPVRVVPDANRANVWHITSIETYLGSQVTEMEHSFTLNGTELIEQEGETRVVYVKCMEEHGESHG